MSDQNKLIRIKGYQFDTENILGKGATGYVYQGYRLKDSATVAIKAINMSQINNQVTQYLLEGEKQALQNIKHQYVIRTEDIIQQQNYCYIVMEKCNGGTLKEYISKKGKLEENQAIAIFRKIISGYISIIDAKIIHRDLKTANIMLRSNNDPVIIDFGYCQMIMGKRPLIHYNVGSPSYMSPEAHQKSLYSQKSDVWALGVILHQMLTGETLDVGKPIKQYFENLKKQKIPQLKIAKLSKLSKTLLEAALVTIPQQRASSHKLKYYIDKDMIGKNLPSQLTGLPFGLTMRKIHSVSPTTDATQKNNDIIKTNFYYPSQQIRSKIIQSTYQKKQINFQEVPKNKIGDLNRLNYQNYTGSKISITPRISSSNIKCTFVTGNVLKYPQVDIHKPIMLQPPPSLSQKNIFNKRII